MLNIDPKKKNKYYSIFSIGSKKFGYGSYNRAKNLISIIKDKKIQINHFSFEKNYKNKGDFIEKISSELRHNKNIILDISNRNFLDGKTVFKLKKLFMREYDGKVFIIDSPTSGNLSTILKSNKIKTLIPFDVTNKIKKELSFIKDKRIGFKYFIYPSFYLKKKKKIYDIVVSFGGSDNNKGTLYVLKLLKSLSVKEKIVIVTGKYFTDGYKKKIHSICKKNYKIISFSNNFSDLLNKSRYLITNSGLTKYEAISHGLKIAVFSDSKDSQKIDKLFTKKRKQLHFSYLRNFEIDISKLRKFLEKKITFKFPHQNLLKNNNRLINNFFRYE